jgi:ABC-type Fe3+ transport system permease subunit
VGWWGAARIAASIKTEAALVSQAEWESSRILGASLWQAFRYVIKPRIQSYVSKELKVVAGACLFDPTPVLIWGVSGWPMAELVHSLQRLDGMGVAVATTWALCMTFVLAVSNGLIQLAIGGRTKNSGLQRPASSGLFRVMTFSVAVDCYRDLASRFGRWADRNGGYERS